MEAKYTGTVLPQAFLPLGVNSKAAVIAAGMACVGTGSVYIAERPEAWMAFVQQKLPIEVRVLDQSPNMAPDLQADIRTAAQHMANIREVLKPPMSALSSFFGLSRQAIYKWISGTSEPTPENLSLIEALSQVADAFKRAQVNRPDTLLLMKAFAGRSLLELIQAGEYRPEHIEVLIREAQLQDEAYQRSGIANSRAPATDDWRATVSIPGGPEPD